MAALLSIGCTLLREQKPLPFLGPVCGRGGIWLRLSLSNNQTCGYLGDLSVTGLSLPLIQYLLLQDVLLDLGVVGRLWGGCITAILPAFPCSPSTSSRFCRDSAISLSLFYNNGAQPCRCHEAGARGSQCEPFGGQCPCKSNVIGRECSRCATGYWGFPNCRRELSHLPLCFPSTCCFASYRAEADLGNGCIFQPCSGSICMKTAKLPAEQSSSASIASCSPWAAWVLLPKTQPLFCAFQHATAGHVSVTR